MGFHELSESFEDSVRTRRATNACVDPSNIERHCILEKRKSVKRRQGECSRRKEEKKLGRNRIRDAVV
jgi:hypothetical protein